MQNNLNYASTSNIREVIKFYNLGDTTFETDFRLKLNRRAARCISLSALYPLLTQSYNKVHSEVQVIYFQKLSVVLSQCGAIAIESTFEIGDLRFVRV